MFGIAVSAVALLPSMTSAPTIMGRTVTAIAASLPPWQEAELAKTRLLAACEAAAMGREADRRDLVLDAITAVESLNPTARPHEAPELLSGCWRLVYTTSDSILGTTRLRPMRPQLDRILQSIDAASLSAKNEEWVLSGALKNQVKAECVSTASILTEAATCSHAPRAALSLLSLIALEHPLRPPHRLTPRDDGRTVDVQFKQFGIGWLRVPAPASARGILETTYLDESLRVSRGVHTQPRMERSNPQAVRIWTRCALV